MLQGEPSCSQDVSHAKCCVTGLLDRNKYAHFAGVDCGKAGEVCDIVAGIQTSAWWAADANGYTSAVQIFAPTTPNNDFVLIASIGFEAGWRALDRLGLTQ